MKINQFLKTDIEAAKRKMESVEDLSDMLSEALQDDDFDEAISMAGTIKVLAEDLSRMANKARLYEAALKMQQRKVSVTVTGRAFH
ncbi:YqaH family protein [Bacillus sp. FSL K6-1284]|uniref:YqaH family protein n=1 Tax=Bacillus sp. FSL K6-1284 TaxID=2921468 RepID=UPI0030F64EA6